MRGYRQFTWLVVLTSVAGFLLALTTGKAGQNAARRARFREHALKEKGALELGVEVCERIQITCKSGMTLDAFRAAFGPLTELRPGADPQRAGMTHSLFHEKSQRTFYLRFTDGKPMEFSSSQGTGEVNTGVVLETPAFVQGESLRGFILLGGLVTWCGVLVTALRVPRVRGKAGALLVALAMVCGLCWFLAPNYTPTWRGISSNDNLGLFVLLLAASLAVGAAAARPDENVAAC